MPATGVHNNINGASAGFPYYTGTTASSWPLGSVTDSAAIIHIASFMINSTSITMTAPASNVGPWTTLVNDTGAQSSRFAVFYRTRYRGQAQFDAATFTTSSAVVGQLMSSAWLGVDHDAPFIIPPSTATMTSAASGTSMGTVDMSPDTGAGMALYVWMAKFASSGTTATFTIPTGLVSAGNPAAAASGAVQTRGRGACYGDTGPAGIKTPSPTGTFNCTISLSSAWRSVGMVLRPARNGLPILAAS